MPTYVTFMFAWVMVGVFQGFYYGPQYGLSSEAIPKHRITLGSAIINSGMAFGLSIGYYISSISVGEMGDELACTILYYWGTYYHWFDDVMDNKDKPKAESYGYGS